MQTEAVLEGSGYNLCKALQGQVDYNFLFARQQQSGVFFCHSHLFVGQYHEWQAGVRGQQLV